MHVCAHVHAVFRNGLAVAFHNYTTQNNHVESVLLFGVFCCRFDELRRRVYRFIESTCEVFVETCVIFHKIVSAVAMTVYSFIIVGTFKIFCKQMQLVSARCSTVCGGIFFLSKAHNKPSYDTAHRVYANNAVVPCATENCGYA